jgi:hypothetical protein
VNVFAAARVSLSWSTQRGLNIEHRSRGGRRSARQQYERGIAEKGNERAQGTLGHA